MKDIHFLADELEHSLNEDIQKILTLLQHPDSGKKMGVVTSFMKYVIYAEAQRQHALTAVAPIVQEPAVETTNLTASLDTLRKKMFSSPQTPLPPPPNVPSSGSPSFPAQGYYASVLDTAQPVSQPETKTPETPSSSVTPLELVTDYETGQILAKAEVSDTDYYVFEPEMSEREWQLFEQLKKDAKEQITILQDKRLLMRQMIRSAKKLDSDFNEEDYLKFRYYLVRDLFGYGVAEPLLHDKAVEKVICDGPAQPLVVVRQGKRLKTNIFFKTKDALNDMFLALAEKTYQHLTVEDPVLDVTYRGLRVQGTLGADIVSTRFIMTRLTS